MSIQEQVRNAATPQEAMLAIAAGLDVLLMAEVTPSDPWGALADWVPESQVPPAPGGIEITQTEDSTDINFKPVSREWEVARRSLATQAQLDEQLGEGMVDAYVKGGPLWLYLGGSEGRDYILGLPEHMRREMVADLVANASQQDAEEFARDVLKAPTDQQQGAAAKISEENILNQRRS